MENIIEQKLASVVVKSYAGALHPVTNGFHGKATSQFDNNCQYTGIYRNGLFAGKGEFKWKDGTVYEGEFKGGKIQGKGRYIWNDGSKYEGNLCNCKRDGTGAFEGSSGQSYSGEWKDGKKHGKGTLYFNAEKTISYKGDWKDGLRSGYGTITYPTGNTYEGYWLLNKKHGKGIMQWGDKNEIYLGDWALDKPQGWGEHIWIETYGKAMLHQMCNIYRGQWDNGLRQGYGTFFYGNGSQYTGMWCNNKKHGYGYYCYSNGNMIYGQFSEDRLVVSYDAHDIFNHRKDQNTENDVSTVILHSTSKTALPHVPLQPSETDAVSVQYCLPIIDVLLRGSSASSSSIAPTTSLYTHLHEQTSDIERILLRYHTIIKALLKRYRLASISNKSLVHRYAKRSTHPSLKVPKHWSETDKLFYQKKDLNDKLFTMSVLQLIQFARECDFISHSFTAYDICMCVRDMREGRRQQCVSLQNGFYQKYPNLAEEGKENSPSTNFEDIWNMSFQMNSSFDVSTPLRDFEFIEMVVRLLAEISYRQLNGLIAGADLLENVFKSFAEVIEPLIAETKKPSIFVSVFYSDAVQSVIYKYQSALCSLWDQVNDIAITQSAETTSESTESTVLGPSKQPQVRHVVHLLLALKGTALCDGDETNVFSILKIINKKHSFNDMISLMTNIIFEDFVEIFCRVVVSDLWIFGSAIVKKESTENLIDPSIEEVSNLLNDDVEENTFTSVGGGVGGEAAVVNSMTEKRSEVKRKPSSGNKQIVPSMIVENEMAKRLSEWLQLI